MIHYHCYEPLTPTTQSLLLYPDQGEAHKHPVVELRVHVQIQGQPAKKNITIGQISPGNYGAEVPDLSEDSIQKALALIIGHALKNPCAQTEIEIHFYEQPTQVKARN